jgi:hypothetical protein
VSWFSLQLLSETFLIPRRIEGNMIKNVHCSSCKVTIIFVRFWWNLNSLDRLLKNIQMSNFMKIRPVGAELLQMDTHTHTHTDMTKLIVTFRNFTNTLKVVLHALHNFRSSVLLYKLAGLTVFASKLRSECVWLTVFWAILYFVTRTYIVVHCTETLRTGKSLL